MVLVSARKGAASHMTYLENIPLKLEKHFSQHSKLVIFPQQYEQTYRLEGLEDVNAEPLNKGIETIQKIGKSIEKLFKK